MRSCFLLAALAALATLCRSQTTQMPMPPSPCYDGAGEAQACFPPKVVPTATANATATNTCGKVEPEDFCRITILQDGNEKREPLTCASRDFVLEKVTQNEDLLAAYEVYFHPPSKALDEQSTARQTWWQSQSMAIIGNQLHEINFTISLGKAYELDSLDVRFWSIRPESWVLHKSSDYGKTWSAYEYFSRSCSYTYSLANSYPLLRNASFRIDDDEAICTSTYNARLPVSRGLASFDPLANRRVGHNYRDSPVLRDWVTVTDLRFEFNRLGTFSDEISGDSSTQQCYFYSIEDVIIRARCQCHGHANSCVNGTDGLQCDCQHNTMGRDCQYCQPFYVDRPWQPATSSDTGGCAACQCNSHSTTCEFSSEEYERSGNMSGGVCQNCDENTAGAHCQYCSNGYFRTLDMPPSSPENPCQVCQCNVNGTVQNGCDELGGECTCRNSTEGALCDQCKSYAYDFGSDEDNGCTDCECVPAGTMGGSLDCNSKSGQCTCRAHVEGRQCGTCKDGFWNLDNGNSEGCVACDCSELGSLSNVCNKMTGQCTCSAFMTGRRCDTVATAAYVPNLDDNKVEGEGGKPSANNSNVRVMSTYDSADNVTGTGTLEIFGPGTVSWHDVTVSTSGPYIVVVRYLLDGEVFWQVATLVFEHVMGTGEAPDPGLCTETGSAASFQFDSPPVGSPVSHRFDSEACLRTGVTYRASLTAIGGNESTGSSIQIDSILLIPSPKFLGPSGTAIGNSSNATYEECIQARANVLNAGQQLGDCDDWETAIAQQLQIVKDCDCSVVGSTNMTSMGNDSEAIACEVHGGQCPCKFGVAGRQCDRCEAGHHDFTEDGCRMCSCNPLLSVHPNGCDPITGNCACRQGIDLERDASCDHCLDGFRQDVVRGGCIPCGCHAYGSVNASCDDTSGDCTCIDGVESRDCSECAMNTQYLSENGCMECDCDMAGSLDRQCNSTGACQCRANTEGPKCATCAAGTFALSANHAGGCKRCFCHGHTTLCDSAPSAELLNLELFQTLDNSGLDEAAATPDIPPNVELVDARGVSAYAGFRIAADGRAEAEQHVPEPAFIQLTGNFSGNLQSAYGSILKFDLARVPSLPQPLPDVYIQGMNGTKLTLSLSPAPSSNVTSYRVPLVESSFSPQLSSMDFQSVLADMEHIRILVLEESGGGGSGFLSNVQLSYAMLASGGSGVPGVELCNCPAEYQGRQCEMCAEGYRRAMAGGGPLAQCVRCECNGHSNRCNAATGECDSCQDNTDGYSCQDCMQGFYGNATEEAGVCLSCDCNVIGTMLDGNNQPLPCDTTTGQCPCKEGVTGRQCDLCSDDFFNLTRDGCTACACSDSGSNGTDCDPRTGQCECIGNVGGRTCDRCPENFHNLSSGCTECPACYGIVLDLMTAIRSDMAMLEGSLVELADPSHPIFSDEVFNASIFRLLERVTIARQDINYSVGTSLALRLHLRPLMARLKQVKDDVAELKNNISMVVMQMESHANTVEKMRLVVPNTGSRANATFRRLSGVINQLLTRAEMLFVNRTDKVSEVGNIATKATSEVSKQEVLTTELENQALQVKNETAELLPFARLVNASLHENEQHLRTLQDLVSDAERLLSSTQQHASATAEDATLVLSEAEKLVEEAGTGAVESQIEFVQQTTDNFPSTEAAALAAIANLTQALNKHRAEYPGISGEGTNATGSLETVQEELRRFAMNISLTQMAVNESVIRHRLLFDIARDMRDKVTNFHERVEAERMSTETARADVALAANLTQQARRLLNMVNEEINMTRDTVRGALDVANASVLTLHELRQLTLDSDSQGLLDRIANFVELASNLRNLSALILNRSRQSLQQAMDTRDTVISMLVQIRELYVRFVKQGERIEAGGKAIDDIYADVAARSTEILTEGFRTVSIETTLDVFNRQKEGLNFIQLIATLEANGQEVADQVAKAEDEYRRARAAIEHLKQKDRELPSECIRSEAAP